MRSLFSPHYPWVRFSHEQHRFTALQPGSSYDAGCQGHRGECEEVRIQSIVNPRQTGYEGPA
jgi:hypothetical protein